MEDKFVGKRLDGRYEIHQLVGVGGMAQVYKAYDKQEDKWVAIKILKDEFSENNEFLRRFRNESKTIAMLSHPNIVKVSDVSIGDRIQYIVMEYISGITIKDYIAMKTVIPWKDAIYFTYQILKALEHAHEKGVIHRDIKPQNIILLKDGTIKVTDFGIARVTQNETQTMTDKALGSVHYIPPEQARGEYTNNKADIYSLGVMMYEMLTGKLPFEAESAVSVALMQVQANAENPRKINPEIPVGLEEITMKAMEKNPALRFQSATQMLEDIVKLRQNPEMIFAYKEDLEATKEVDIPIDINKFTLEEKPRQPKVDIQTPEYNDNYEYEEELVVSKRRAKGSMIITGVVAALILIIVSFSIYLVWDYMQEPEEVVIDEVEVPNFVGMIYQDEVEGNVLYENNFVFVVVEVVDESKTIGEITRQSPNSGINVKIGREITLYVVVEKEDGDEIPIPDVIGLSETEAYNTIQSAGFVPNVSEAYNEYTEVGYVISTEPDEGSTAVAGTEVTIYVSKGPVEVPVSIPTLTGETLTTATALLEGVGLSVGDILYDETSEEDKDIVVSCSPTSGSQVSEGTAVDLVLSSGALSSKTVNATIGLPSDVVEDLTMKVYYDGALYQTVTVNPVLTSSYSFEFTGKTGSHQIVVYLNDKAYIFATLEFESETGSFTIDSVYDYVVPETSVPEEESSEPEEESSQEDSTISDEA